MTLNDTATLSGGYYETGTITFTLYLGNTLVDTETVPVTGNGTYTTPTGYTLPTTGTVTGTYQWDASYSGDTNNNSASENNAATEQVVVSPASPAITTTPERHRADPGHVAGDLEGHGRALGRLLRDRDDHVHALPGQHAGGHRDGAGDRQRHVHDADRLHAADHRYGDRHLPVGCELQRRRQQQLGQREQRRRPSRTVVSPASPAITTTPSTTCDVARARRADLKDTATLSGGYYETGTITFTLTRAARWWTRRRCRSTATARYTTPTGYTLPTTGTVTGTYQWDATLQRRRQQQLGQREQRRRRAGDGERGESGDHDDAER